MSDAIPRRRTKPGREEIHDLRCPRCMSSLALHQPDTELPHRLLAVCENCKSWYVSSARGTQLTPVPITDVN
jgi:C4-type Zn-finger protein